MLFVGVIIHTKYAKTAPTTDGFIGTMTVILTLYVLIDMDASDSGACFNPTIGITVSTFQEVFSNEVEAPYFKYIIAYIFGPLTGAVLTALFAKFVAFKTPEPPSVVIELKDQRKSENIYTHLDDQNLDRNNLIQN